MWSLDRPRCRSAYGGRDLKDAPGNEPIKGRSRRRLRRNAGLGGPFLAEGDTCPTVALHNVPPSFAEDRQRQPLRVRHQLVQSFYSTLMAVLIVVPTSCDVEAQFLFEPGRIEQRRNCAVLAALGHTQHGLSALGHTQHGLSGWLGSSQCRYVSR